MKQYIQIFMVLALAIALTSCASTNVTQTCPELEAQAANQNDQLKEAEWEKYATCLDKELADLNAKVQQKQTEKADLEKKVADLDAKYQAKRSEREALEQNTADMDLMASLNDLVQEYKDLPTTYTVRDGDFLKKISGMPDIYNDPTKWTRIYHENKKKGNVTDANGKSTQLRSPNLLYPGWILKIPRDWPDTFTVVRGDCLWKIAGYWWVFNDPTEWVILYAKNKSTLRAKNNPDLIYPDEELNIPRGLQNREQEKKDAVKDLRNQGYWK